MIKLLLPFLLFSTSALGAQKYSLALNWKAEPEFGGFYAAQMTNEFKKRDLDVSILEGGSGTPTIQMLANDKVDFAIVGGDEILIAMDRNSKTKIKALFAVYQKAPYILMAHAEKNYPDIKSIFASNSIVSVQAGLPYYQYLTEKFGKPKGKVVPYAGGVANFLNDKNFVQQGFLTTEPLSAEKSGAKVKSFLIADEGFNPYTVVVACTEETLKKNPEAVKKIVEAISAGWTSYLKDPAGTNKLMAEMNKAFDFETFQKAAQVQLPLIETSETKTSGLGSMTEARWTELSSQMKKMKLIKKDVNAKEILP